MSSVGAVVPHETQMMQYGESRHDKKETK